MNKYKTRSFVRNALANHFSGSHANTNIFGIVPKICNEKCKTSDIKSMQTALFVARFLRYVILMQSQKNIFVVVLTLVANQ